MSRRAQYRLALAVACLTLTGLRELRRPSPLPVVVLDDTPARPHTAPLELAQLEPNFAARMTPDDVARGMWALAQGEGPGLTDAQAAHALPQAQAAHAARQDVDRLRGDRRAARARLRSTGAAMARALAEAGVAPKAPQ